MRLTRTRAILILLLVTAAGFSIPRWILRHKVHEAKQWCEEVAELLDNERAAYAEDALGTFLAVQEEIGWLPELVRKSSSLGGGIEEDGEILVSFQVSSGSYLFSDRTGWTSRAVGRLVQAEPQSSAPTGAAARRP